MRERFYDILLPLPFDRAFSYKSSEQDLDIGHVVKVPFGKKSLFGVIIKIHEKEVFFSNNKLDIKKIKEIIQKNEFLKIDKKIIEFIDKISSYNMAPRGQVLKAFIGFINSDKVKDDLIAKSCMVQNFDKSKLALKNLSEKQEKVADEIIKDDENKVFLIDGVTGSGKTEIYFKIIANILQKNQDEQILIMLPEIALTSQITQRFEKVFGIKPALWHSKISKKDKRQIFYGICNGSAKVVLGARSSLLLPFKNLKLIIVDEEHDSSYKQDEIFRFNARDMSILKSTIDNFKVILCSATPSLESYYNAKKGKYRYFLLDEKFNKKKNKVTIIDLTRHKLKRGTYICEELRQEIAKNYALGHQTLLFANRRGYSPVLLCGSCSEKCRCKNCEANLVYHKKIKKLICHYCGYEEDFDKNCKKCGKENSMINIGVGVERIKDELLDFLPQARTALVTSDNLTNFKEVEELVSKISNNEIDVIIGTQMIAKGYDFENLTLVGVVDADSGFYSSDLRALERSYQLLSQVFGRAGRKKHEGKVFIQSYDPQNYVLQKLIEEDKKGFYEFELKNRKIMDLYPFSKMAQITIDSLNQSLALKIAKDIVKNAPFNENVELLGPAPKPIARLRNRYYYSVFIKVNKKINLQKLIFDITNRLDIINQANIKVDIDP